MATYTVHTTSYKNIDLIELMRELDFPASTGRSINKIVELLRDMAKDERGKYYELSFQLEEVENALTKLIQSGTLKMRIVCVLKEYQITFFLT